MLRVRYIVQAGVGGLVGWADVGEAAWETEKVTCTWVQR